MSSEHNYSGLKERDTVGKSKRRHERKYQAFLSLKEYELEYHMLIIELNTIFETISLTLK